MRLITRRSFIHLAALAAINTLAASCFKAPTFSPPEITGVSTPKPSGFVSDITFYAGLYKPSTQGQFEATGEPVRSAIQELANEWNDLHPLARLTFIQDPGLISFREWISSQILMGTGPDCFVTSLGFLNYLAANRGAVPLDDSLNLANLYTTGGPQTWGGYFGNAYYATKRQQGMLGGVPLDRTATGLYANLDLLQQAGIDLNAALVPSTGAPPDWVMLLDWITRLRAPGMVPFSMATSILDGWLQGILADQFFWGLTERFDTLNYHPASFDPSQPGQVSQEEIIMQIACNGWQPFSEPAVRGLYQFIIDLVPYLPVGCQTASIMGYSWDHFMQGKLALLWEGCWLVRDLTADTALPFEWISLWLPPVTTASTPFAHQPPIQPGDVGGIVNAAGINIAALKRDNVEQCQDWLMFLTSPANNARLVNELPMLLPAVRDAEVLPMFTPLFSGKLKSIDTVRHTWPAPIYWLGDDYSIYIDTFQREWQFYLEGERTFDAFMDNANGAIRDALPTTIKSNALQYTPQGTWDLTQWPCMPNV